MFSVSKVARIAPALARRGFASIGPAMRPMVAPTASAAGTRLRSTVAEEVKSSKSDRDYLLEKVEYSTPTVEDAKGMYKLVVEGTLDTNSAYAYMIFSRHFEETCIVAKVDGEVYGFVKGYCPPTHPDTYFVWQVGVSDKARGLGLASKMLLNITKRLAPQGVQYLEATVTPYNDASMNLFRGFATKTGSPCAVTEYFSEEDFPSNVEPAHEAENLFRIGPFSYN